MTVLTSNRISIAFTLAVSLCLSIANNAGDGARALAAQSAPPAPAATPAPAVSLASPALEQKGQAYKMSPDDSTWREFLETLRIYLSDGNTWRAPSQSVIQQNKALKDMQTRVLDAGGVRIWTFPGSQHSHSLVIQSGAAPSAEGVPSARVSIVPVPETVNITAARIVKSVSTTTKAVKVGRKMVQKTFKTEGPSLLAVAGLDRVSGLVYLGAYKPVSGAWVPTAEPFSQIPSSFMQTVSGQASFSGNDLLLSVSSQNTAPKEENAVTPAATGLPRPKSSAYQIVLKFVGGRFVLAGSPGKDMPLSIVSYFVQCMRQGRMDLAKAWVQDPALISIPKYINLVGKNSEVYKLVPMSTPGFGGARYRLVTNGKHDLIFEVGKVKKDLMIRGLFIAPPDPLARSLNGTIIGAPAATPAQPSDAAKQATTSTPASPAKSDH